MTKNDIVLRPSYWASVSGGKDSLYMLMLILANPEKYPLDGVVHFELEIDYPFIKDVVDLMEEKTTALGIPFVRVRPNQSWFDLEKRYGIATRKVRWCNSEYKLDAMRQLKNFLKSQGKEYIAYIGYCADEVKRFKEDKNVYPLALEGIQESTILEWAKNEPIFNDFYKYNKRCGCMYCPMATMTELAYLYKYYPDNYNWFISECIKTEKVREKELGRPFSIFQPNPKYNAQYYDKRVKEKYIIDIGGMHDEP